jgi:hypothetical protein
MILLFSAPAMEAYSQTSSQESTSENIQVEENITTSKKKDKDKDKLQLDETFYIDFLINLATIIIIVVFIYYPNYRNKDAFFTFFLFNIAIFLLTFLMNQIKISMGAAFGLFAVFSMLRYRTEGISMKDMTYLFIVIAIGLVSAIQLEFYKLGIINGIVVVFTFLLDGNLIIKREFSKRVQYDNIELIKPEQREELIADLKNRTGLNISRISIVKIDFLRDMAIIDVHYYNGANKKNRDISSVDTLPGPND